MSPAQQLGPYRLVERIGRGGMGEVWKAHDSRLGRDVAVKLSAEQFTDRFEKEARAIAALNHPNICTLFDVGPNYLVMELIEGPTLADRIEEGPIPLEEALAIAHQIADALEAAHEKNIVHRDLKPANIKLRADGSVKVLDFGLAKAGGVETIITGDSPTMLHTPTQIGVILGTAAYMAPEQARGKNVDKRADIWSFGVVLHEMLTGKRTFEGEDLTDTLASVVKSDPDLTPVPHKVRRLLAKCLQKDPKKRLRDIGDVWDYVDAPADVVTAPSQSQLRMAMSIMAGVLALALAAVAFLWLRQPAPEAPPVAFSVEPPPGLTYTGPAAISPDGRYLVFAARKGQDVPSLWLRPIGSLEARELPVTQGGNFNPFWSPDSKSVAFHGGSKLKRIDIAGGSAVVLCDMTVSTSGIGGTWNEDGVIVFASSDGLRRVAASGGVPAKLIGIDAASGESGFRLPQFLPGGKRFLYFIQSSNANTRGVYAGSLDNPREKTRVLGTENPAVYVAPRGRDPGELLWLRDQTLMAQSFDAGSLRLSGDPVPVAENVSISNSWSVGSFWVSDTGLLVYRTGDSYSKSRIVWMSREGKRLEEAAPEDKYGSLALSPDGKRVAVSRRDSSKNADIWVYDLGRKIMNRLTFDPANDRVPQWSPDGRYVAFDSDRTGPRQLYRKDAGGAGQEEQLTSTPGDKLVDDWSRDGKYIVYSQNDPKTQVDLWALPAEPDTSGKRTPVLLLQTQFNENNGKVSPDGKWLAYESNQTGSTQVYVQAFPVANRKWRVSNGGGRRPQWRGDGKEIYYDVAVGNQSKVMAVGIKITSAGIDMETPHELFSAPAFDSSLNTPWVPAPDGQRFLIDESTAASVLDPLTVVVNWRAGLKK